MKKLQAVFIFTAAMASSIAVLAATPSDLVPMTTPVAESKNGESAASDNLVDGEIRKVDTEAKKITIKHGEIKNLDMPGMTMVFQVKVPAMLDKVKVGDKVKVYPSELSSTVSGIYLGEKSLDNAISPESVDLTLTDDIDISRGDVIVSQSGTQPMMEQDVELNVCWFRNSPLTVGKKYVIRHASQETFGIVKEIEYKIDINTQDKIHTVDQLVMNDIARVHLKTADPLVFDYYKNNRTMGSLIFIEDGTNDTVGAGMIVPEEI